MKSGVTIVSRMTLSGLLLLLFNGACVARVRVIRFNTNTEKLQHMAENAACSIVYATHDNSCIKNHTKALRGLKRWGEARGARLRLIIAPYALCGAWEQYRQWLPTDRSGGVYLVFREGKLIKHLVAASDYTLTSQELQQQFGPVLESYMIAYNQRRCNQDYPRRGKVHQGMSFLYGGYYQAWAMGEQPWNLYSQNMGYQRCM